MVEVILPELVEEGESARMLAEAEVQVVQVGPIGH